MSGACYEHGWNGIPEGQPGLAEYWGERTTADGAVVCAKDKDFFGTDPLLDEGVGYAIVLGFGAFFSIFTTFLVFLDQRYVGVNISSEFFNTAGRSVKTGLTASVIVSQWTWAATLLQSSNVAFTYGVSGPFWYASGATIQVLLFGILAIEVKRKATNAHTICEIIDARWGATAHKVFIYFSFMTNVIVSSMLILGGAATVNALTGMSLTAASFLIPMGVIMYTMAGGLKATFLASYLHTAVIFVVLCLFIFIVYTGGDSSDLGSSDRVYDFLELVSSKNRCCEDSCMPESSIIQNADQNCGPVSENEDGSYLTMISKGGLQFGIINIVGNFGTVFVDQSYWQSAIAARPSSSHKGYLLGGLCWFCIPFSLATALGLACVALDLPVTADEASAGLVPPAAAVHFMGKGGGILITIMLFMAITSTGSAEQIAVSSLFSYDVYRKYINPAATGEDILRVSRQAIFGFGIFMGVLAIILNEIGLSLGWVYLMMGIFIGSAVIPIALVLTWDKANAEGAIAGALCGQVLGVIFWVISAQIAFGEITIDTLGGNDPMLTGNLVAILSSGAIHVAWSFFAPQNFDFALINERITLIDDTLPMLDETENDEKMLTDARAWITKWGVGFTVIMVIIWPVLSVPAGVFSKGYFSMWVIISIIWGLVATIVIVVLPLYESQAAMFAVVRGLFFNDDLHARLDEVDHKMNLVLTNMGIDPKSVGSYPSNAKCYRSGLLSRSAQDLKAVEAKANYVVNPKDADGTAN